jgi:hypothetical protein
MNPQQILKIELSRLSDAYNNAVKQAKARAKAADKVAKDAAKAKANLEKTRVIAKSKLTVPCADICAICLDTHQKCDSITTECGHEFGKECWHMMVKSRRDAHHRHFNCPACRKVDPSITMYKGQKPRLTAADMDEEEWEQYIGHKNDKKREQSEKLFIKHYYEQERSKRNDESNRLIREANNVAFLARDEQREAARIARIARIQQERIQMANRNFIIVDEYSDEEEVEDDSDEEEVEDDSDEEEEVEL